MKEKKKFQPIYLLAICYVVIVYMASILCIVITNSKDTTGMNSLWFLCVPILFGIFNTIYICTQKAKIGADRLLNCTVLIKYLLIPFYIAGGLLIAALFLLIFTPLVFMVFLSPLLITMLSVMGWLFMVGAAPFSLGYISEARKNGRHGKVLCVFAAILQFFFTVDVVSIMFLALKEKKCVKVTITTLIILGIGVIGTVIGFMALISLGGRYL